MGGNAWRVISRRLSKKWLNTGDRPTGQKGRCHLTPLPWVNINGGNENSERRYIHERLDDFYNPEFGEIRTVGLDGEPLLVGKDVALALG